MNKFLLGILGGLIVGNVLAADVVTNTADSPQRNNAVHKIAQMDHKEMKADLKALTDEDFQKKYSKSKADVRAEWRKDKKS